MNRLRAYLIDFDSRRAVLLFLCTFAIGATGIWFDVLMPWLPGLMVFAYGGILLYTAKALLISHSELTNNSPYFLAFILFLTSVLSIFSHSDISDEKEFLSRLGAALVTTIIGIPFRQLLFAYAPAQQEEDKFFRILEEQLRQSAAQYQKSQTDLVNLISEFVSTRRTLFEDEEKASERYVSNLNKAVAIFDDAFGSYPRVISAAFTKISKSLERLGEKLSAFDAGADTLSSLELSRITEQFSAVASSSTDLASGFESLKTSALSVRESIRTLPDDLTAVATKARSESESLAVDLKGLVFHIHEDVRAVDRLLTDFIIVIEQRVAALDGKHKASSAANAAH
jgi:hypothetical protein